MNTKEVVSHQLKSPQQLTKKSTQLGLLWGSVGGALVIVLYYYLYKTDVALMLKWFDVATLAIALCIMLFVGISFKWWYSRKIAPGFRQLVRPMFIAFIVLMLCRSLFHFAMFSYIAPNLTEQVKAVQVVEMQQQLKAEGASDREINRKATELMDANYQLRVGQVVNFFVLSLIPGFFIALLLSVIIQTTMRPYPTSLPLARQKQ